jgi:hypothetical protein
LGEGALDQDPPAIRAGLETVRVSEVERVNETVSKLTFERGQGSNNTTFERSIEHKSTDERSGWLQLVPRGLPRIVEVRLPPSTGPTQLSVTGPPAAFLTNASAAKPQVQAEQVSQRLQLPGSNGDSATSVSWNAPPGPENSGTSGLPLLGDQVACLNGTNCSEVRFGFTCQDCFMLWRTAHPTPGEEMEAAASDLGIGSQPINVALFVFSPDEELIGAFSRVHLDVDETELTDPDAARDRVVDALDDRNYSVNDSEGHGLDSAGLTFDMGQDGIRPIGATYNWAPADVEAHGDTSEPLKKVDVEQDALTGEIVNMTFRGPVEESEEGERTVEEEPPNEADERPAENTSSERQDRVTFPGEDVGGLVAALATAAAITGRRLRTDRGG